MKVYLATSGEYSDYRIEHVFAREEDADAYQGADRTEEREVREGPVEMRYRHYLMWTPELGDRDGDSLRLANPYESHGMEDYDGRPDRAVHRWDMPPVATSPVLRVEGWDLQRVRKVYSEQRAQYLARVASIS